MFPGAYFAEGYFTGYYWPPILGGPYIPTDVWVIWVQGDE